MNALFEQHAGKIGSVGTVATLTAGEFSAWAAGGAAVVTIAAVLPVATKRWRELFRKK